MSDGKAKQTKGSFGLIFSNQNKKGLLRYRGPVYGYNPSSFKGEAFGAFAVTRIIYHLVQTFGHIDKPISHHMDNMGVITRLDEINNRIHSLPQDCFKAEWDVLVEIKATKLSLGVKLITTHKKRHQDKHKKYEELPLMAQLNVDADHLASQALAESQVKPRSPLFAHTAYHLILNDKVITSRMKQELRRAYFLVAYGKYMEASKGWSTSTWETIQWEMYTSANQKTNF